jgi:hypothetical protein
LFFIIFFQVVALVSKSADSSLDAVDSGLSFIESNEIAKFVQKMGPEVSPSETDAIEKMLKAKDPSQYLFINQREYS